MKIAGVSNSPFVDLKNSKKRYNLVSGGRNSGKTIDVILYLITEMLSIPTQIMVTRYTMTSNETSIYATFSKYIQNDDRLSNFFIIQKDSIKCTLTGAEAVFKGIKTSSHIQTANLKGLERFDHFVIDEAEEWVDEDSFDKLDYSIRTKKLKCKIIIILNPCYKTHWIYKRFIKPNFEFINIEGHLIEKSKIENVNHIICTYHRIIKHLNEDIIYKINLEKNNSDRYAHIILGKWAEQPEGLMYPDGITEMNLDFKIEYESIYSFTDLAVGGSDYFCTIFCFIRDKKFHVFDAIYSKDGLNYTKPMLRNKIQQYDCIYNFIEMNRGEELIINEFYENYGIELNGVRSTTNKLERIMFKAHLVNNDFTFQQNGTKEFMLFKEDLKSFPKKGYKNSKEGNDDAPDTLNFAQEFKLKNQNIFQRS